jgi:AbrB family looped-hinge helix DNA binding protein
MKTTNIIRRVDDLGRVAIPKDILRRAGWREGDLLEIYTDTTSDGDTMVGFKACYTDKMDEVNSLLSSLEALLDTMDEEVLVTMVKAIKGKILCDKMREGIK